MRPGQESRLVLVHVTVSCPDIVPYATAQQDGKDVVHVELTALAQDDILVPSPAAQDVDVRPCLLAGTQELSVVFSGTVALQTTVRGDTDLPVRFFARIAAPAGLSDQEPELRANITLPVRAIPILVLDAHMVESRVTTQSLAANATLIVRNRSNVPVHVHLRATGDDTVVQGPDMDLGYQGNATIPLHIQRSKLANGIEESTLSVRVEARYGGNDGPITTEEVSFLLHAEGPASGLALGNVLPLVGIFVLLLLVVLVVVLVVMAVRRRA